MGLDHLQPGGPGGWDDEDHPLTDNVPRSGVIRDTAVAITDELYVLIDGIDDGTHAIGPCRWEPRVDLEGGVVLPAAGNTAMVVIDDAGDHWISSWYSDATGTGGGTALASHISNPTGAHAATAISVNPSGLIVVSGTNVQSALAQVDAAIALKAPIASPAFTGTPTAPTVAIGAGTNLATIGAVNTALGAYLTTTAAATTYAPLASPALTGNPTAPTQTAGNNSTRVATTAYADGAVGTASTADRARANHTGTQTASTISDFDTQVRTSKIHQLATPTAATPMGSQKFTGLAAGTTAGDSVRYEQVLLLAGGTMAGNIAMGTNKLTGLAAGTANGDSLRYEQLIGVYLPLAGGTLTGNFFVSKANPVVYVDATSGASYVSMRQSGADKWQIIADHASALLGVYNIDLAAYAFTIPKGTNVVTFTQIPELPASDPTTANQASRKSYVAAMSYAESARVYNSANISLTSGTDTALTFNSERHDTASIHDTSSNTSRLTAPTTGVYEISGTVGFAASSAGYRQVGIRLNGTTYIAATRGPATASPDVHICNVSTQYKLTAGDYVELTALQSSGGALNALASANYSPEFAMTRIANG